jgi:hypothetical protein
MGGAPAPRRGRTSSTAQAKRADDPVALPWIAGALERLGETLRALAA